MSSSAGSWVRTSQIPRCCSLGTAVKAHLFRRILGSSRHQSCTLLSMRSTRTRSCSHPLRLLLLVPCKPAHACCLGYLYPFSHPRFSEPPRDRWGLDVQLVLRRFRPGPRVGVGVLKELIGVAAIPALLSLCTCLSKCSASMQWSCDPAEYSSPLFVPILVVLASVGQDFGLTHI